MSRFLAVLSLLVIGCSAAFADAKSDCENLSGDAAIRACDQAIRQNPRDADSYLNRAVLLSEKNEYDRAIADFTKVIEIGPVVYSYELVERGRLYARKKDYDRAIADYSWAIKIDPNAKDAFHQRGVAYGNRGVAYGNKGDYDRAIADYTRAIEIDPNQTSFFLDRAGLYGFRARSYASLKYELDRAIDDYTRVIEIDPTSRDAFVYRGNAYVIKGDFDRALADYTRYIALDPKRWVGYSHRCWLLAASNRDLPLALEDSDTAMRLAPGENQVLDSRGLLFLRLNRIDEAIAAYDAALKISQSGYSLYGRGLAKRAKGDHAGANADIAAAKAIGPDAVAKLEQYGFK